MAEKEIKGEVDTKSILTVNGAVINRIFMYSVYTHSHPFQSHLPTIWIKTLPAVMRNTAIIKR